MKRTILISATLFLILLSSGKAQINLIGAATPNTGGIEIVTWDALDSSSAESYATNLTGYYLTSSVFDAYNGKYYLAGLTETSQGLFSFNTMTLEQNITGYTSFSNITEIDMSSGKIYNITADSLEYFSINEYDIETGEDSLLGVIYEPGTNGIIVDAIAFNSNDGILYYLGYDSLASLILYSVPVRDELFSYTKTTILPGDAISSFWSLNYDNVNGIIYALNPVYDMMGNYVTTNLSAIDPVTGEVTVRSELNEFMGFVMGSAAFDQNTGSYLVIAIDTNYAGKMMVFDTYTNTYITGWAPDGVSEIVCDNTAFATVNYITTSVKEQEEKPLVSFYPNPATTQVTVVSQTKTQEEMAVSIFDITGKKLISNSMPASGKMELDVSHLVPGLYFLQTRTTAGSDSFRLVIR